MRGIGDEVLVRGCDLCQVPCLDASHHKQTDCMTAQVEAEAWPRGANHEDASTESLG